ncbi:nitrite reductase [Desulfosediminicola flagellatus]|uniref:nitrite reductase n=1 Tax=Desulfosediminicola flagellatus TaxID=2569541 RepID=UPI0010ABC51C|nr:nitrite reductase [Desulfosediminicola flagellatus]
MEESKTVSITVLVPAGRLPLDIMEAASKLASEYSFGIYLSTAQNLRLIDVPADAADAIKAQLAELGADFKGPGKHLGPRVCIGKGNCNLGVIDTAELSRKIVERCAGREKYKAKLKTAISGCTMCCSNVKTTDIGVMATREGYEVFAGGKGGPFPKVAIRIEKTADEERVLDIVEQLVEFHDSKTATKQRMYKLLNDPDFPFAEV